MNIFYRKADLDLEGLEAYPEEDVRNSIAELCEKHFDASFEGNVELKNGTFHYVYVFDVEGRPRILKAAKYENFKEQLFLEDKIYSSFGRDTGMGVNIRALDLTCAQKPFSYMIMDAVEGRCLRDLEIDSPLNSSLIKNLGTVMARYHAPLPDDTGFGLFNTPELVNKGQLKADFLSWNEYVLCRLNVHLDFCRLNNIIVDELKQDIEYIFEEHAHKLTTNRCCLLHGDLGSHNIFYDVETEKIKSIIDWEDALAGDPLFDIAIWLSFFRMEEYLEDFLSGYQSINDIFDEKSNLKLWLYYLRIVVAKSVLRFKFGYDKQGDLKSIPKIMLALENIEEYQ